MDPKEDTYQEELLVANQAKIKKKIKQPKSCFQNYAKFRKETRTISPACTEFMSPERVFVKEFLESYFTQ